MKRYSVLVSPEAKGAFFQEYLKLAKEELSNLFPNIEIEQRRIGPMDFFDLSVPEDQAPDLATLSFAQGLFFNDGGKLTPQDFSPSLHLHQDFLFASKFRGKTNERLTQWMLNVAIAHTEEKKPKIFDPMCGRATSLLWAMAYGLESRGIEQDQKALDDVTQITKKWLK